MPSEIVLIRARALLGVFIGVMISSLLNKIIRRTFLRLVILGQN